MLPEWCRVSGGAQYAAFPKSIFARNKWPLESGLKKHHMYFAKYIITERINSLVFKDIQAVVKCPNN